jgi:phenylalanyl-tRNA synthetase beta chain
LFDVYRPKQGETTGSVASGEKSLALRLHLHAADATLNDEQIEQVMRSVVEQLGVAVGARLR